MEEWRPVVGWEPYYEVSNMGQVRRDGKLLKPVPTQNGADPSYRPLYVTLSNCGVTRNVKVAILVLSAFIGPRPLGEMVRHYNDDQDNNRLDNLKWGTDKQNGEDRARNNRMPKGESNGNVTLTTRQVQFMRRAYKPRSKTRGLKSIAERLRISVATAHQVISGKTWKDI
jgi:hypothetical protein